MSKISKSEQEGGGRGRIDGFGLKIRTDCRFLRYNEQTRGLDYESTADRGLAENFGPDSGLCMSGSSDCRN